MTDAGTGRTSSLRVRDEIQKAILAGLIKPGERLRAEGLAQRFGTSRTPVREALVALEADGLVELEPRRGAVVRAFDAADLIELYELRAALEPYAAARAATRIDADAQRRLEDLCDQAERPAPVTPEVTETRIALNVEFHRIILDAAGSPRLTEAMRGVAGIPSVFRSAFWRSAPQVQQSLFCHRQLTSALAAGQAELAEATMRMHILGAREFLLSVARTEDAA